MSLADFYSLPIRNALDWILHQTDPLRLDPSDPVASALHEVRSRLTYLGEAGLGYLTLDRPTRTLSGGETQRVNLTSCLGTRLVNTLYVLDEPSVGLHPRDTDRLVRILTNLRNRGNTVVVVEHEAAIIQHADQIVDLGPGQGHHGGHVVFQGSYPDLLRCRSSLTGRYLAGTASVERTTPRPVTPETPRLLIAHASRFNLRDLTVSIPLGRFVCLTGVSGSGKSTLVREIVHPILSNLLRQNSTPSPSEPDPDEIELPLPSNSSQGALLHGWQAIGQVLLIDQSSLGKTPRSNPAVYTGAFDEIRALFAQQPVARQQGLKPSSFSFNSPHGQCHRCRGAGFERIEMQFLSDIFIRCPDCDGRRYQPHLIDLKILPPARTPQLPSSNRSSHETQQPPPTAQPTPGPWSIADLLDATVDESIRFLNGWPDNTHAQRAIQALNWIREVGLGYLQLGQPVTTLSGGECQRLKLAGHLATFGRRQARDPKPSLLIFDEPTTGLHFEDIRLLLRVFQRLVSNGHSLLVIEHNLDVVRAADWILDLGPDAGPDGGQLIAEGTPDAIAASPGSHTGHALRHPSPNPHANPVTRRRKKMSATSTCVFFPEADIRP
jgi:excinuclease ABC subunit A